MNPDAAGAYSPAQIAQLELIDLLNTVGEGRIFAIEDACTCAVHYQGFYEDLSLEFAALRADYEQLMPRLVAAAAAVGCACSYQREHAGALYPLPYASLSSPLGVELRIYPLDKIPNQVTLRFKLFGEALEVQRAFEQLCAQQRWEQLPQLQSQLAALQRYNALDVQFCARLVGSAEGGHMGERTVFTRSIELASLQPMRRMPFEDRFIYVPACVANWTAEMTPARMEIISIIQHESMESLAEIDRVCGLLGIDYFLCGGSMLGALRHGGFIPWDDDMDVGMLRSDYVRFMREAPALLQSRYFVQLPGTDKHDHFVYARLRKEGINYITSYNEDKDFHKGLWIDIFPFDARPKNEALARVQRKCANMLARASMGFKRRKEYVEHDVQMAAPIACEEDERYLRSYLRKSRFFPVTLCRAGYHVAARILNPLLLKRPGTIHASYIPSYTTITTEEELPTRRVTFQDGSYPIPNRAEDFLTRQYGDYMALPPVHLRYAEHGFKYLQMPDGTKKRP